MLKGSYAYSDFIWISIKKIYTPEEASKITPKNKNPSSKEPSQKMYKKKEVSQNV